VDYILVTTEETRKGFLLHFPFLNTHQVITIPNGTPTSIIKSLHFHERPKFTLGYIGKIDYIRDPLALFKALHILENSHFDYEFIMVGALQDFYQQLVNEIGLNTKVKFLGKKAHREALEIAKSCHVLIYLGNISNYQLPSKIWEYLALCKPILAITKVQKDIGARIVRQYKRGLIVQDEPKAIAAAMIKLIRHWQDNQFASEFDLHFPEEVDWKERGRILTGVLPGGVD